MTKGGIKKNLRKNRFEWTKYSHEQKEDGFIYFKKLS
jgi:hypothetical protein